MRGVEIIGSVLLGAAGGLVAGLVIASFASKRLDQKLEAGSATFAARFGEGRAELDAALAAGRVELERTVAVRVRAEVPPVVRAEVERTLGSYGLTPSTGRQIATVLGYAERAGLLGVGRAW